MGMGATLTNGENGNRRKATPRSKQESDAIDALIRRIDARKEALGIREDAALCLSVGLQRFYLNGVRKRQEPGIFSAAALARGLECSVDYLAGVVDEPAPPFDEKRFVSVFKALIKLINSKTLALSGDEAAELALHVYCEAPKHGEGESAISNAIIGWLSEARHRSS